MKISFSRSPRLDFGPGAIQHLGAHLLEEEQRGNKRFKLLALITGNSFMSTPAYAEVLASLKNNGIEVLTYTRRGEPDPAFVDSTVASLIENVGLDEALQSAIAVVAIGGGSSIDAGKAIAAMIPVFAKAKAQGLVFPSVKNYLEGVGEQKPEGQSAFFIACPSTAGTGTEATKNAVISEIGSNGFKKSLRHEGYIPAIALIDPELALSCTRETTAASGLDALTQLIEAWTSPAASTLSDALCGSGVAAFAQSFERLLDDGSDLDARSKMAYAAYLSGLGLANAGLGAVHALASPLGGTFPIPHGAACGLLLQSACHLNIERLKELKTEAARLILAKYARAGFLLASGGLSSGGGSSLLQGLSIATAALDEGLSMLFRSLEKLEKTALLQPLRHYGIDRKDLQGLAQKAATKTNPVPLSTADYEALLATRL